MARFSGWQKTPIPARVRTFEQIFAEWKTESLALNGEEDADLRKRLRLVFGIDEAATDFETTVANRWVEGRGATVLAVHRDGINAAAVLVPPGRAELLIDVLQTG